MTTIKITVRTIALVLRSVDWAAVGRFCWNSIQLLIFALVLAIEIAWEHREQIQRAVVVSIAAVIYAARLTFRAGRWTRQAVEGLSSRSAALLPHQPIPAIAPITATLAAAREALERLVSRLYPNVVAA